MSSDVAIGGIGELFGSDGYTLTSEEVSFQPIVCRMPVLFPPITRVYFEI